MVSAENAWLTPSPPAPQSLHQREDPQQQQQPSELRRPPSPSRTTPIAELSHLPGPQTQLLEKVSARPPTDHDPLRLLSNPGLEQHLIDHHPRPRGPGLQEPHPPLLRRTTISQQPLGPPVPDFICGAGKEAAQESPRIPIARTESTTTTDSTAETEDELTARTLSSIAAAISTIKEIRRESINIEKSGRVGALSSTVASSTIAVHTTSTTVAQIAATQISSSPQPYRELPSPISTFYLPTPEEVKPPPASCPLNPEEDQLEAIVSAECSRFNLATETASHQPPISNTIFYLPPPPSNTTETASLTQQLSTPTRTFSAVTQTTEHQQTASTVSPTSAATILTPAITKRSSPLPEETSPSTPSTEIPVIFVNTKKQRKEAEIPEISRFLKNSPESAIPSTRSDLPVFSHSFLDSFRPILQKHQQLHEQKQLQQEQLKQSSVFHVPLEVEDITSTGNFVTETITRPTATFHCALQQTETLENTTTALKTKFLELAITTASTTTTSTTTPTTAATTSFTAGQIIPVLLSRPLETTSKHPASVFYDTPIVPLTVRDRSSCDGRDSASPLDGDRSDDGSSGGGGGGGFEPCHIAMEERLLQTAAIWYLPDLHRLGAVHLLQGQPVGCFIVRQSSKPSTLAITVRLPPSKGPHVEHYLIEVHQTIPSGGNVQQLPAPRDETGPEMFGRTPPPPGVNTASTPCSGPEDKDGDGKLDTEGANDASVGNRIMSDNNNPNASFDSDGSLHRTSETNKAIGRNNKRANFNSANNNETTFPTNTSRSGSTVSSSGSSSTPVLTYSLEASENRFDSASALIAHYASCCDELPVQLALPKKLQDAKSRKELHSLALLGQEYWRTAGAVTTSTPSGSSPPNGGAPTASPPLEAPPTRHLPPAHGGSAIRPVDLNFVSFSSFGKSGVISSSNASLFSPATHHATSDSCSNLQTAATSVFPNQQAGDRSSLHLNLAPLDDILKEPPTFLSFKGGSQQGTPMTPLRPHPPHRVSPPSIHPAALHSPAIQTPTVAQSPTLLQLQTPSNSVHTPTSTGSFSRSSSVNCQRSNSISNNPPTPPPRWAKSTLSTPNSNGTITTTLTFPVNQVKELPLKLNEGGELLVTSDREELMEQTCHVVEQHEQVCRMQVTELTAGTPMGGPQDSYHVGSVPNSFLESCVSSSFKASGVMNRHRDQLDLHIRQNFMSPQSTPCTPCIPTTPISTPLSEEGGESRARLRKTHKDRRRHSNHYHDVNVIDNTRCYRSSLADKISDYEDVWSSPPRDSPSSKDCQSPKKISRKMSTFKPNNDISKSLGDLSDISQNKSAMFVGDNDSIQDDNPRIGELNGNNSFDSIPSFRNTNSPFYVEPADCLRESENRARIKKTPSNKILTRKIANRFSDSNIQWRARQNRNLMSKIESNENLNGLSSSAENLMNGFDTENDINAPNAQNFPPSRHGHRQLQHRNSRGKPVAPPRVSSDNTIVSGTDDPNRPPWRLDSSWRYQSCDTTPVSGQTPSACGKSTNSGSPSGDARFPLLESNGECESGIMGEKTVFDLITEKLPNLPLPADNQSIALSAITKVSEYDNVAIRNNSARNSESINNHINNNNIHNNNQGNLKVTSPAGHCLSSSISDSGTEFSEPWDSRKWDSLLQTDDESSIEPISLSGTPARPQLEEWDRRLNADALHQGAGESGAGSEDDTSSVSPGPMIPLVHGRHLDSNTRSKILSPQLLALRHRQDAESGASIRKYSLQLGTDSSAMFAQNIEQFIRCTLETSERDPEVVVRNVRQFMSGMKNYLVTSGEKQFEDIVKKERSNLKATEFLNLDAILEDVLVRLVLRRLWHHITALYVDAFTTNESIQRLANNMTFARSLHPEKLGIRAGLSLPTGPVLEDLKRLLAKMQRVYAPREKLELLLTAISLLYHTLSEASVPFTGDADDLVPMMMWVLSHCGFFSAEIEADYMTGLLLTSSSCGEARYYLTAFHSAIHSLKNLAPSPESTPGNSLDSVRQDASLVPEPGTLKIIVPDEHNGSIVSRSLPVRPNTTSKELCKMMAHKMRVTNPQDYGLYKLVDGVESALNDHECPHAVRSDLSHRGLHCIIAFKRTDAKIAWPIVRE